MKRKSYIKKRLLLFMTIISAILLTGCSLVTEVMQDWEDEQTREEKSLEICETVSTALKEQDIPALKALFCDRVQSTHDLDTELQELFAFFEGNIVSYGEIDAGLNNGRLHSASNLMHVNHIEDVRTDSGKMYTLYIRHYLNWKDDSNANADLIGIHDIRVVPIQEETGASETEEVGRAGELFETIIPKEIPGEYRQIDAGAFSDECRQITSGNILLALKERNTQAFYDLFADEVQNEQLYSDIESAVAFIDGEILYYSVIWGGTGSKTTEDGYITKYGEEVDIYDITTDTGAMYEISYFAYHIYNDSPEKQGVHYMEIKRVDPQILDYDHEVIEEIVLGN